MSVYEVLFCYMTLSLEYFVNGNQSIRFVNRKSFVYDRQRRRAHNEVHLVNNAFSRIVYIPKPKKVK